MSSRFAFLFFSIGILLTSPLFGVEEIPLWPGTAPDETGNIGEEHDGTQPQDEKIAGKRLVRLANVSKPTLAVHRPTKEKETGCAVLICPGGAYKMLASEHEGTEVAAWLNELGITAIVLKYRVPARDGMAKHAVALQDAQRALGIIRNRAGEFGIDPKRIGVLGFSAGGHLAATLSTQYSKRSYPKVDATDEISCKPDFTVLIYPAYLSEKGQNLKLNPEIEVNSETPTAFIVHTQDDPVTVESSLAYAQALHLVKVKFELHVFPFGGHGYGLRRTSKPVTEWPARAESWFKDMGFIKHP